MTSIIAGSCITITISSLPASRVKIMARLPKAMFMQCYVIYRTGAYRMKSCGVVAFWRFGIVDVRLHGDIPTTILSRFEALGYKVSAIFRANLGKLVIKCHSINQKYSVPHLSSFLSLRL